MEEQIIIPVELYSSKNSKQIFYNSKTKKPFIAKSDVSLRCERELEVLLGLLYKKWIHHIETKKKPYKMHLFIYRKTRRIFDYVNIYQLLFDVMQKCHWLEDDNMENLQPVFDGWAVDKNNPRVEIWVE